MDGRVRQAELTISRLLDRLENFYGPQQPHWPLDPYEFLVWWQCGYPASDAACARGWKKLQSDVGIAPEHLLSATPGTLASALKPGGIVPELRALRLKEIAMWVKNECDGDLRSALTGPLPKARKMLKKLPGIGDPGADRILLFAGIAPVAAVPSNAPQVLVRILDGHEEENYVANYRAGQRAIAAQMPETFDARTRAYLLVKTHGQEICKRTKPRCGECPVNSDCAFFAGATT
jgi:endonuclease-3